MVEGTDDVLTMAEQKCKTSFKEVQFQSTMRIIVVISISLFRQSIS